MENNDQNKKENVVIGDEDIEVKEAEQKSFTSSLKEVLEKIAGGVNKTLQKAGDTFEANRVRAEIKELDLKISDAYRQIGESVYRSAEASVSRDAFEKEISLIEQYYSQQKELLLKEMILMGKDAKAPAGEPKTPELPDKPEEEKNE
ncbi:MAG: hypothetical protein IJL16_04820 [Clostridia bacterium]|nr:hypothetical protein [Clostridia bacterium]